MKEDKKEEFKVSSLDEIIKNNPTAKETKNIDYEDEDEEEESDTMFPLSEAESKYYDEEGNFYPDRYEEK